MKKAESVGQMIKSLVPGRSRDLFPCYCVQTSSGFPLSLLFFWVLKDNSAGVNG